jgi:hypothetical protein
MSTKTEAEKRFEAFRAAVRKNPAFTPLDLEYERALFSAIFDPLPPEPERPKLDTRTLGHMIHDELAVCSGWVNLTEARREEYEQTAQKIVAAHEARRPKPTVEEVAMAIVAVTQCSRPLDSLTDRSRDLYLREARSVFPLFGVTP